MRACIKCQKDFTSNTYAGRVTNVCNFCDFQRQKEYREKNKESIKEYQSNYRKKLKLCIK